MCRMSAPWLRSSGMMADGGAQWRRMHENLLRAGMTGGSGRIADLALKLAEEHTN